MSSKFLTSGLCGWYHRDTHNSVNSRTLLAMQSALNTSLAFAELINQRSTCATTGDICQLGDNGCIAVVGKPIFDNDELNLKSQNEGPAKAISAAYFKNDIKLLKNLSGEFLIVINDVDKNRCIGAVDHLGRYPLYYAKINDGIVFSSAASSLHKHPDISRSLCNQGIYNYVYFHMVPSPSSIYAGIHKLSAGNYFEIDGNNLKVSNYWSPKFENMSTSDFDSLTADLKILLKKSVKKCLDPKVRVGAFLSGGLDSSTVVGMMSEVADQQADAFSIGFSAKGYDEMAFARITAKHFGVKLHEYYVTPEDVVEALPIVATSYDEPFGNSSALPAYFCAKFAKEQGIDRLLAGDGGDELFAGNERYAKQGVFEAYHHIPSWIRKGGVEPLVSILPSKAPFLGKVKSYIAQANIPLPDRLQTYNFLHQHQPEEIFSTDFLSEVDTTLPIEYQQTIYSTPNNATALNRMLYLDWQYTLADNDLRKVSHMCAMAGVEVSYPMLDDELVHFSTKIPDKWKLDGQKLRHFYKESLRGWLPDETINKKKQGFGLPFGVWMRSHKPLQDMAYDTLSQLKKRHYFNQTFLDKVIDLHRHGHASYYGELVWILTVLEFWLAAHTNTT